MLYKIIAVNKDGSTYKHEEIVESDSEYSALQSMLYQNKLYHNLDLSNCELTATPVTIKSITFVDNSEYDPDKCRNGGSSHRKLILKWLAPIFIKGYDVNDNVVTTNVFLKENGKV